MCVFCWNIMYFADLWQKYDNIIWNKRKRIQRGAINNWQSRETGNIGYTRRRQTKQSKETCNIVYTRRRQTTQKQSRETGNIGYTKRRQTKQKQSRETGEIGYGTQDEDKQNKHIREKLVT